MKTSYLTLVFFLLAPNVFAADSAMSVAPSDGEIAQIVMVINHNEVEAGKMAKKKSKNMEVKEFADMMILEHEAVSQQMKQVAKKNQLKTSDCAISNDMKKEAQENERKLKEMKGTDFDKEYINEMVAGHQAVLDSIDNTLQPNAKGSDLKALITKIRPAVATHLQHAKALQSKFASPSNAG